MPNLNMLHLRRYVDRWKKLNDKLGRKLGFPFNLGDFPSRKHGTSLVMVRFMKGVHDDISQTFSNFYQGMVRSYHGTMPGVMISKHLFHFSIVENPTNKHLWLTIATHFIKISVHSLKRHEKLLNGTSMVFQAVLVDPFMHQLFELELCALMPRKCT